MNDNIKPNPNLNPNPNPKLNLDRTLTLNLNLKMMHFRVKGIGASKMILRFRNLHPGHLLSLLNLNNVAYSVHRLISLFLLMYTLPQGSTHHELYTSQTILMFVLTRYINIQFFPRHSSALRIFSMSSFARIQTIIGLTLLSPMPHLTQSQHISYFVNSYL